MKAKDIRVGKEYEIHHPDKHGFPELARVRVIQVEGLALTDRTGAKKPLKGYCLVECVEVWSLRGSLRNGRVDSSITVRGYNEAGTTSQHWVGSGQKAMIRNSLVQCEWDTQAVEARIAGDLEAEAAARAELRKQERRFEGVEAQVKAIMGVARPKGTVFLWAKSSNRYAEIDVDTLEALADLAQAGLKARGLA